MQDVRANTYRDERPRSRIAVLALLVAVLAAVAMMAAGPGSRAGLWDFRAGFQILKWATYAALAGAGLGLIGALRTRPIGPLRGLGFAVLAITLGLVTAWVPWSWKRKADRVPPIHDITTDTASPPTFQAMVHLREDAPNPLEYGGDSIAQQQRQAYPDIEPLLLDVPPEQAYSRALEAARDMGWEIVFTDPAHGRIEATDTTFWFGFKDDVVVRIYSTATGSRVDVRSVSRVGRSDVGTNAERIREYLSKVRQS
jgi:uncharacterized protein (DUF1499 family)